MTDSTRQLTYACIAVLLFFCFGSIAIVPAIKLARPPAKQSLATGCPPAAIEPVPRIPPAVKLPTDDPAIAAAEKAFRKSLRPRPFKGAKLTAAMPLYSTGVDQSAAMQALYDNASDGDTLTLKPQNGQPFVFSGTLDWSHKGTNVNVEATGAWIEGSGTATCCILYGAPVGQRTGATTWHGGTIEAAFVLRNHSYSAFHDVTFLGGVNIAADTVCSYNTFDCGQITGDYMGVGALHVSQGSAGWCNKMTFRDGCLDSAASGGTGAICPLVTIDPTTSPWAPSLWYYVREDIESPCPLFDTTANISQNFDDCYFEPQTNFTMGNIGPAAAVQFRDPMHGFPFRYSGDPRLYWEGIDQ